MTIAHTHAEYQRRIKDQVQKADPIWLIVIDEADQDAILGAKDNRQKINDIVQRGRSLKMHVVIGTHRPTADCLGGLRSGLTNRWLGAVADAQESGQVMGGLELHKLSGAGDFYHVAGPKTTRFQVAMTTDYHLSKLYKNRDIQPITKVAPAPTEDVLAETGARAPGRPRVQPEPRLVAFFLFNGEETVSQRSLRDAYGATRRQWAVNKKFAKELRAELAGLGGKLSL
jgi:DNA segregation ATPase FtsK/SpoIIIE-like protein